LGKTITNSEYIVNVKKPIWIQEFMQYQ